MYISPALKAPSGRNVVAYGMLNALTSKYKTMVFRPAVSNHDEFTPILLAASNAGLGVALSTGLDVHKVREDKTPPVAISSARSTMPWTFPARTPP